MSPDHNSAPCTAPMSSIQAPRRRTSRTTASTDAPARRRVSCTIPYPNSSPNNGYARPSTSVICSSATTLSAPATSRG
jgi:hypothetical protein